MYVCALVFACAAMPAIAGDEYEDAVTEFKQLVRGGDTEALSYFVNNNYQKIFDRLEESNARELEASMGSSHEEKKIVFKNFCAPGKQDNKYGVAYILKFCFLMEACEIIKSGSSKLTYVHHKQARELLDIVDPQQSFVSAHPYVTACIGLGMVAAAYYAYQWWADRKKQKEYEQKQQPQMPGMGNAGASVSGLA